MGRFTAGGLYLCPRPLGVYTLGTTPFQVAGPLLIPHTCIPAGCLALGRAGTLQSPSGWDQAPLLFLASLGTTDWGGVALNYTTGHWMRSTGDTHAGSGTGRHRPLPGSGVSRV